MPITINDREKNIETILKNVDEVLKKVCFLRSNLERLGDALWSNYADGFPVEIQNAPAEAAAEPLQTIERLLGNIRNEARYQTEILQEAKSFRKLLREENHPERNVEAYAQHLARHVVNHRHGRK